MSGGFDATISACVRGAVPLDVAVEPASTTLLIPVLDAWLMRGIPEIPVDVWLLEGVIPVCKFVEPVLV